MLARTAWLFAAALFLLVSYTGISSHAQTAAPAALTGKVSSAEEGLMEGVVIRAKKGIVTVSVVSNDKGEFSFPAAKLGPGTYTLSIRATGYDLTGPSTVTLAGAPLNLDLKLAKTKNIAAQLTNLEWITQRPGHRAAEEHPVALRQLPHARARHRQQARRRRLEGRHQPDGDLFQQQLPSEAAGAQGSARHGSFRAQYR